MGPTKDDTVRLFVPGRICLFGEHSDWASEFGRHNGYCLVIGTDQGLLAWARRSDEFSVESAIPTSQEGAPPRHRTMSCPWNAQALLEAAQDRDEFFRHCAGVAHEMLHQPRVTGGIELHIERMDLPLKKGVSSSAAVCVLVASAFDAVYDLGLFPHELMEVAYLGERLTGSLCGRMDQACIFGKTPVLLTFEGKSDVRIEPVFPYDGIDMFFVDLAGQKDTVRILDDLRSNYLRSNALRQALGADNERLVRQAYRALSLADAERLGALMREAQRNFDEKVAPHSPSQLASPLLHELLSLADIQPHVFGGKGVGSQGDGTAQFVARSAQDREAAMRIIETKFPSMRCFPLTIVPAGPGKPAGNAESPAGGLSATGA